MPIDTDFKFGQVVVPAPGAVAPFSAVAADPRGLLAGFVGNLPLAAPGQDNPKRRWQGQGFNLIWRPNFNNQTGTKDFFLELNATDEILDDMDIDNPFDLLGLFQGVGLPFRTESAPLHMPNMIWLYRRPILDYWSDHEEALGAVVAHVLVHEIGHHFGLSDADMEAIEAGAD